MNQQRFRYRAWNKIDKVMYTGLPFSMAGKYGRDTFDIVLKHPQIYEVMQYTGIVDKNDVSIYEGDIVRHIKSGRIATVVWHGTLPQFCVSFLLEEGKATRETDLFFANKTHGRYEVIGNVYENAELLQTLN